MWIFTGEYWPLREKREQALLVGQDPGDVRFYKEKEGKRSGKNTEKKKGNEKENKRKNGIRRKNTLFYRKERTSSSCWSRPWRRTF